MAHDSETRAERFPGWKAIEWLPDGTPCVWVSDKPIQWELSEEAKRDIEIIARHGVWYAR